MDGRSDLFSAGVVVFQLLTGERPFAADDIFALKDRLLDGETPLPSAFRADLPPRVDAVVAKALARSAEDRYARAEDFAEALTDALAVAAVPDAAPLDLAALAARRSGREASAPTSGATRGFDERTLGALERALAESVGPMARLFVRRACETHPDARSLLDALAADIPTEAEARRFRARASESLREALDVAAIRQDRAISEAEVAAATERLATYVGPVARVLARRGAETALDVADFHRRLAESIPDARDRASFIASRRPGGDERR